MSVTAICAAGSMSLWALGGSIWTHAARADSVRDCEVRIEGDCYSACTMYLRHNACVSRDARLHFHGPRDLVFGVLMRDPARTRFATLWGWYLPDGMREWFQAGPAHQWAFTTISGAEVIRQGWVRECAG